MRSIVALLAAVAIIASVAVVTASAPRTASTREAGDRVPLVHASARTDPPAAEELDSGTERTGLFGAPGQVIVPLGSPVVPHDVTCPNHKPCGP